MAEPTAARAKAARSSGSSAGSVSTSPEPPPRRCRRRCVGVRLAQACASLYSLGILGLLVFFVVRQSLRYRDARASADRATCSVQLYRYVSALDTHINTERGLSLGIVVAPQAAAALPVDARHLDTALDGIGSGPCYAPLASAIAAFKPALAAVRADIAARNCTPLACSKPFADFQEQLVHAVADVGGPFMSTSSMAYVASVFLSFRNIMASVRALVYEILWSLTIRPIRAPPEEEIRELTGLLGAWSAMLQLCLHAGPQPIRDLAASTLSNVTDTLTRKAVERVTSIGGAALAQGTLAGIISVPDPVYMWNLMTDTVSVVTTLDSFTSTYFADEVDVVESQVREELALAIIAALVCLLALFATRTALLLGRRETELQREKEAGMARRIFVRYVFHEVRVPLQSVALGIELLRDSFTTSAAGGAGSPRSRVGAELAALPAPPPPPQQQQRCDAEAEAEDAAEAPAPPVAAAAPPPTTSAAISSADVPLTLLDDATTTASSGSTCAPEEASPPDPAAILAAMSDACSGMSRIMGDVLDWERMEAGKFTVERVWHAFPASVAHVVGLMRPLAAGRGVRVMLSVHNPSRVLRIAGDKYRLRQVVANLLSNACKYAPRGTQVDVGVAVEVVQVALTGLSAAGGSGEGDGSGAGSSGAAAAAQEWTAVATSDSAAAGAPSPNSYMSQKQLRGRSSGRRAGLADRLLRRRRGGRSGSGAPAAALPADAATEAGAGSDAPASVVPPALVTLPASASAGAGVVVPLETLPPPQVQAGSGSRGTSPTGVEGSSSGVGVGAAPGSSSRSLSSSSSSSSARGVVDALKAGLAGIVNVTTGITLSRRRTRGPDVGSAFLNHVISVASGSHAGVVTARPPTPVSARGLGGGSGSVSSVSGAAAVPASPLLLAAPVPAAGSADGSGAGGPPTGSGRVPPSIPPLPLLRLASEEGEGAPSSSPPSAASLPSASGAPAPSTVPQAPGVAASTASDDGPSVGSASYGTVTTGGLEEDNHGLVAVPHRGRVRVTVSVRDRGVGIPKPDQARLFRPFEQIRSGDNQKGVGTGLGLVISASIVALHGGAIWVDSAPGAGATFTFAFESEFFGQLAPESSSGGEKASVPCTGHCAAAAAAAAAGGSDAGAAAAGDSSASPGSSARSPVSPASEGVPASAAGVPPPFTRTVSGASAGGDAAILLDAPAAATPPAPSLDAQLRAIREAGLLALVVDDYASNRVMLAHMLSRMGLTVDTAEDGAVAVALISQRAAAAAASPAARQYDVVFMDKTMPVLDGAGASSLIRENGFRGTILGVTGNALSEDIAGFVAAGADLVLPKPVPKEVLVGAIYNTALGGGNGGRNGGAATRRPGAAAPPGSV